MAVDVALAVFVEVEVLAFVAIDRALEGAAADAEVAVVTCVVCWESGVGDVPGDVDGGAGD